MESLRECQSRLKEAIDEEDPKDVENVMKQAEFSGKEQVEWRRICREYCQLFIQESNFKLLDSVLSNDILYGDKSFGRALMESAVELDSAESVRILCTNGMALYEEASTVNARPWSVFAMSFWRRKPKVLEYVMNVLMVKIEDHYSSKTILTDPSQKTNPETLSGATIEPYDSSRTILMEASEMMDPEILSVVLKFTEKRSIEEASKEWPRYTALQWCFTRASRYNEGDCLECVKLLIEAGADADSAGDMSDFSQRPLCLAIQRQLQSVALYLLQRGASIRGGRGTTALMIASEYRHDAMINLLVRHGSDVHARDDDGKTAVWYCFNRVTEVGATCVLILIVLTKHGYDIKQDNELWPLALTAPQCVQFMAEAGVDVNFANRDNQTVLMGAAETGDSSAVLALISAGADVNMIDNDGWTALHYLQTPAPLGDVAYQNWFLSWEALFNHWTFASVNVAAEEGTLLHRLLKARYLLDDPRFVPAMVKAGADPNSRDENNQTPLMTAVQLGCPDLTRLFMEHGGDLNARDEEGRAPLHFLTTIEDTALRNKMAEVFIQYGADLNVQDAMGSTVAT